MKEKNFQTQFGKWIKANPMTGVFELKSARGNSLPFSAVVPHQIEGLWHAKHEKIYMKLPDVGYQMPFDCFCVKGVPAYVVIRYESGAWYMIDIDRFIEERDSSARKSLTEERARIICTVIQ